LDETLVDEYSFPIYNPTENSSAVIPYTKDIVMKYPKPGYNNPLVSVHVFDLQQYESEVATGFPAAGATFELDWLERHPKEESIIFEVAWVGNSTLIVKEVNRAADDGNVVLFDIDRDDEVIRKMGRVVRKQGKNGEEGDDGWIESVSRLLVHCCCVNNAD
jgi:dipeptidyl aminopeptidase